MLSLEKLKLFCGMLGIASFLPLGSCFAVPPHGESIERPSTPTNQILHTSEMPEFGTPMIGYVQKIARSSTGATVVESVEVESDKESKINRMKYIACKMRDLLEKETYYKEKLLKSEHIDINSSECPCTLKTCSGLYVPATEECIKTELWRVQQEMYRLSTEFFRLGFSL